MAGMQVSRSGGTEGWWLHPSGVSFASARAGGDGLIEGIGGNNDVLGVFGYSSLAFSPDASIVSLRVTST